MNNTKLLNYYFKSNNITVHYNQPYEISKNAIVERFNRTIAMMLTRWRETSKLRNWYSVIDVLVDAYNHTYHRTIKNKLIDVWNGTADNKQDVTFANHDLKINDLVKLIIRKKVFDEGDI